MQRHKIIMNESVIALIFDFDGTLGPDTITSLLTAQKIAPETFWSEVEHLVKDGWDPPLAYMQMLKQYARNGQVDLSQKTLRMLGSQLLLFPGLPGAFGEL